LNYVVYATPSENLSLLGRSSREKLNLVEVWSELPSCDFVQAKSGNGKNALRAEGEGLYIWVLPSTVEVLDKKPLLRAIGKRFKGRMNFLWVEAWPADVSREQCIAQAMAFNDEQIARAIRSRRTG
jgi:hypothetical protein